MLRYSINAPGGVHTVDGVWHIDQRRGVKQGASLQGLFALHHALDLAITSGAADVLLIDDALSVVKQALGRWRCRDDRLPVHRDT